MSLPPRSDSAAEVEAARKENAMIFSLFKVCKLNLNKNGSGADQTG
jgi:hypothetical protein